MSRYTITASARIAAPAERLYGIIADYRVGHPAILPPRAFPRGLTVLEGGVGEGTVIQFEMRVLGVARTARAVITEPQPGRTLVETISDDGVVTTFTVVPRGAGSADVTFATELPTRSGFLGEIEGRLAGAALRKVYREELSRLADYAVQRDANGLERHEPRLEAHDAASRR